MKKGGSYERRRKKEERKRQKLKHKVKQMQKGRGFMKSKYSRTMEVGKNVK
jgi:hypothetical protein